MADETIGTEIAELLGALQETGFSAVSVHAGEARLYMRRPVAPAPTPAPEPAEGPAPAAPADPRRLLKSPRVGHFYPKDGEGFGKGATLAAGEVYGTIEAMHLKFELRADAPGKIDEFLAAEGEAVEYGQPLLAMIETE